MDPVIQDCFGFKGGGIMALVAPDSEVRFYKNTGLGNGRYGISRNLQNQRRFWESHLFRTFTELSYCRVGEGRLSVEMALSDALQCDYISFINRSFNQSITGFTYYARIVRCEYVNNVTVEIQYDIDWWETYRHQGVTIRPGLIKRQHMRADLWTLATANPFTSSITELWTSEPLTMSKDFETFFNQSSGNFATLPAGTGQEMFLYIIFGQNHPYKIPGLLDHLGQLNAVAGGSFWTNAGFRQNVPTVGTSIFLQYKSQGAATPIPSSVDWLTKFFEILEEANASQNIVGIYYIPGAFIPGRAEGGPGYQTVRMNPTAGVSYRNPKLYRSPYSFCRVTDGCGQMMEYEWEYFRDVEVGTDGAEFVGFMTVNGLPSFGISPIDYRQTPGVYTNTLEGINSQYTLIYSDIPFLPYSVDSYNAYLASQMQNLAYSANSGEVVKAVGDTASGAINGAMAGMPYGPVASGNAAAIGAAAAAIGHADTAAIYGLELAQSQFVSDPNSDTRRLSNMKKITEFTKSNAYIKSMLGADKFKAGAAYGYLPYLIDCPKFNIYNVTLTPAIGSVYDDWLDYYGYSCDYIGTPHVMNYIRDLPGAQNAPHFANISGSMCTYVQADITVNVPGEPAAAWIENMFSAGALFVSEESDVG